MWRQSWNRHRYCYVVMAYTITAPIVESAQEITKKEIGTGDQKKKKSAQEIMAELRLLKKEKGGNKLGIGTHTPGSEKTKLLLLQAVSRQVGRSSQPWINGPFRPRALSSRARPSSAWIKNSAVPCIIRSRPSSAWINGLAVGHALLLGAGRARGGLTV